MDAGEGYNAGRTPSAAFLTFRKYVTAYGDLLLQQILHIFMTDPHSIFHNTVLPIHKIQTHQ